MFIRVNPWLINSEAAHDADARAPVFVDVEAVDFDVARNTAREGLEGRMDAQRWGDEINQRRFVSDRSLSEEFCFSNVATPPVRLDAAPVVRALKDVFAIFGHLQLDHDEPSVLSQCQQIYRPDSELRAACGPELSVQWRDDQTGIEHCDVAA